MKLKISPVFKISAGEYNKKLAEAIKQIPEFKQPEWSLFVKTGVSRERPPQDPDFWYNRTASILRQIYINGVVGVNRLRTRYGGKQNRGMKPEKFKKAGGKIIRTILQQAEKSGILEKVTKGKRFGRKLTEYGNKLLDGIK